MANTEGVSPSAAWGWRLCNAFAIVYFGSTFQSWRTGQCRGGGGSGEAHTVSPVQHGLARAVLIKDGVVGRRAGYGPWPAVTLRVKMLFLTKGTAALWICRVSLLLPFFFF